MTPSMEEINKTFIAQCHNPYLQVVVDAIHEVTDELYKRTRDGKLIGFKPADDTTMVNAWYMIHRLEDILNVCIYEDDIYIQEKKETLERIENMRLKSLKPVHVPDLEPLKHIDDTYLKYIDFPDFDDSLLDDLPPVTNKADSV